METTKTTIIIDTLKSVYPEAVCMLDYSEPYQLMVAGRLSAQCTDKRVNMVTSELWAVYPDLKSLADAKQSDVEAIIRPCGLYHVKAADIIGIAKKLYYEKDGKIPSTISELVKFPGVGRKTANLIIGDVFKKSAYVTDTHCVRIAGRLSLTDNTRPERVEMDLRREIPMNESTDFCHRLVLFGRDYCTARAPKCKTCPVLRKLRAFNPEFKCRLM
jgi:endonuclease-3